MNNFKNDYSDFCCPEVLDNLVKLKDEVNDSYGLDKHCILAKEKIQNYIDKDVDIHFVSGGTMANKLIIAHCLNKYEAVISLEEGHINVHETGAVENTGHKILSLKGENGLMDPLEVKKVMEIYNNEHMVAPKMVYISDTSEIGTVYNKKRLVALHEVCRQYGLYLFLDGARLGSALTSINNDLTINDIANLTDIFYIGGTKNGAMFGEAIIIVNDCLKKDFRYSMKNEGAMLAKSFLVGLQFETLFSDNLFFTLASKTNKMANYLKEQLQASNIELSIDGGTNQIFAILTDDVINKIINNNLFEISKNLGLGKKIVRFVTSYRTTKEEIDSLIKDINK